MLQTDTQQQHSREQRSNLLTVLVSDCGFPSISGYRTTSPARKRATALLLTDLISTRINCTIQNRVKPVRAAVLAPVSRVFRRRFTSDTRQVSRRRWPQIRILPTASTRTKHRWGNAAGAWAGLVADAMARNMPDSTSAGLGQTGRPGMNRDGVTEAPCSLYAVRGPSATSGDKLCRWQVDTFLAPN